MTLQVSEGGIYFEDGVPAEEKPELMPKPWDWADEIAADIVRRGSQALYPLGMEREPMSVTFSSRTDLAKAIADALREEKWTTR